MSTVRITKLIEDDRRLVDPDLVAFLRKKLEKGDILDFTDVVEVAPRILDALLDGWTPEQVEALAAERNLPLAPLYAGWAAAFFRQGRRNGRDRDRRQGASPRHASCSA